MRDFSSSVTSVFSVFKSIHKNFYHISMNCDFCTAARFFFAHLEPYHGKLSQVPLHEAFTHRIVVFQSCPIVANRGSNWGNKSQNVTGCNGGCNGSKMRKCLGFNVCNGVTAVSEQHSRVDPALLRAVVLPPFSILHPARLSDSTELVEGSPKSPSSSLC